MNISNKYPFVAWTQCQGCQMGARLFSPVLLNALVEVVVRFCNAAALALTRAVLLRLRHALFGQPMQMMPVSPLSRAQCLHWGHATEPARTHAKTPQAEGR